MKIAILNSRNIKNIRMKNLKKHFVFFVCISLILLNGCTKDQVNVVPSEGSQAALEESIEVIQDPDNQVYNYIVSLGFNEETIEQSPRYYAVEGDIMFPKDMVVPEPRKKGSGLTEQRYVGPLINDPSPTTVRAGTGMAPFIPQIDDAIQRWNNAVSDVTLVRTTATNADITITLNNSLSDPYGNPLCGLGSWPTGGQAGATITYNNTETAANTTGNLYQQQVSVLTHELGHNLGLAHTGTSSGNHIGGTAYTDANSIMNAGTCGVLPASLSYYDALALRKIYPRLELNPSSVSLFSSTIKVVNVMGTGPVTVRLSGDPGLVLWHGSSSGTTLNLTAPTTIEVQKQWGSGFSRIMLDSNGSNVDMTSVYF